MKKLIWCCVVLFVLNSCERPQVQSTLNVKNATELKSAIAQAKAGDHIVMANGIYKDVEIEFFGKGEKNNPIVLTAETPGKVTIEGASNLKIGGSYLEVRNLHFKNGHTPSKQVILFKINDTMVANNCKVTNCVIKDFTQPNREDTDHWVEFWGRHNELSNNYIAGKSNFGPTIMVALKGNEHINNYHQIVNNYFGPRPRKGGPHGETIQIGDSGTSMTPSHTNVEHNLFERCNGEVEIISSKSNFNTFLRNVFFESEGSLVLRHGNYATIDSNRFIGNATSEFIGGIRVINTGHWITNNYFYKLKGSTFRAPLAVMNGIPKSPLNRYNQVTDVVVAHNTYVDCQTPFQFSVGSNVSQSEVLPKSEIRSARPTRMLVANNLVYSKAGDTIPIKAYDKVDGVDFENNYLNSKNKTEVQSHGLITKDFTMKKVSDRLFVPTENIETIYNGFDFETITNDLFGKIRSKETNAVGAMTLPVDDASVLFERSDYGPSWFTTDRAPYEAQTITVTTAEALSEAIKKAKPTDIISLKSGSYSISEMIPINKAITITSEANEKVTLEFTTDSVAFQMLPKGKLRLNNISLKGNGQQDAFRTLNHNMSQAYDLFIDSSEISGFKSVLEVSKGSFADTISVANSSFKDCKNGIKLNKETNDGGDYNAEFLLVKNSNFNNISNDVINYYRGGYDESTIGGNFVFTGNTVTNCGKNDSDQILINNRGIVNVDFSNNNFSNNPTKYTAILWGEKGQEPVNNTLKNSGEIKVVQNLELKLMY